MKRGAVTLEKFKTLPTSAVILDASGRIVAVNDTWKNFGRRNGLRIPHSAVGSNYIQYCRPDDQVSRRFIRDLKSLLAGRLDLLTFIYPCHSPTEERWFSLIGLPLSLDKPAGVALLHVNLTDMLPLPSRTHKAEGKSRQRPQVRLGADLGAISSSVEHSVSETLSSQLNEMFAGRTRDLARDAKRQGEADRTILIRDRLTRRQQEVLRLLGEGKTNKEMAKALFVSPNTIKLHVSAILKRLKLRGRTQAALFASDLNKVESINLDTRGVRQPKNVRTAA
jgi:DNA-binding CsgD family transcriptional regulator